MSIPMTTTSQPCSQSAICEEEPALPVQDADSSSTNEPIQDTEESHNTQPELKKEETHQSLSFTPVKRLLTRDEMENFAESMIEEYVKINDL
ncbi:hypothetical protein PAMP_022629 [Pampus punctatissimus]